MSVSNFQFFLHREPHHEDSLEQLHAVYVENMQKLDGLLSWKKVSAPALPDFGEELLADYVVQYPLPSLSLLGLYTYRGVSYEYGDEALYDDKIIVSFNIDALHLQYARLLHSDFPLLIQAFGGYLARGLYADFATRYQRLRQSELDRLRAQKKVNVNGRNNIFSLQPVQFWGAALCQKALSREPDEIVRLLSGKVPLVRPLMDGVYVVFSDNPDLTFEEYCAYNDALKPVLGLI